MAKNPAAVELGRLGGLAGKGKSSPAKAQSARENGKKGGRPKKAKPESH
jgi:general stress protein YciG